MECCEEGAEGLEELGVGVDVYRICSSDIRSEVSCFSALGFLNASESNETTFLSQRQFVHTDYHLRSWKMDFPSISPFINTAIRIRIHNNNGNCISLRLSDWEMWILLDVLDDYCCDWVYYLFDRTSFQACELLFLARGGGGRGCWGVCSWTPFLRLIFLDNLSPGCPLLCMFLNSRCNSTMYSHHYRLAGIHSETIIRKRQVLGMVFTLGNSGGIVSSQVYRAENAPRYLPGHGVTLGFCIVSWFESVGPGGGG